MSGRDHPPDYADSLAGVVISPLRVAHFALPFLPPRTVIVSVSALMGGAAICATAELSSGKRFTATAPIVMASSESLASQLVYIHRFHTDPDFHAACQGYSCWEEYISAIQSDAEEEGIPLDKLDLPKIPTCDCEPPRWGEPRYAPGEAHIIEQHRRVLMAAQPEEHQIRNAEVRAARDNGSDGVVIPRVRRAGKFDA